MARVVVPDAVHHLKQRGKSDGLTELAPVLDRFPNVADRLGSEEDETAASPSARDADVPSPREAGRG